MMLGSWEAGKLGSREAHTHNRSSACTQYTRDQRATFASHSKSNCDAWDAWAICASISRSRTLSALHNASLFLPQPPFVCHGSAFRPLWRPFSHVHCRTQGHQDTKGRKLLSPIALEYTASTLTLLQYCAQLMARSKTWVKKSGLSVPRHLRGRPLPTLLAL